ncbi:response regulator [Nitrososphaera viennensis]|uniref:Response regulator n=2 Tax=Nitrososphaera viennensis TaxID=1034015 RepID=A0A977NLJ7_9ARCH|nr:response regulator [Nitrososphaera viennensis]AIC16903.1 putative signal transduction response regulator, receiver domain [Nitrososphaera viennensis EN76]UVS68808.1 response regulator [Nitrososphaera viennensis]
MRILIIDDSHDITDLLVKVLTTVGHEVTPSDNGREGLAMINDGKFDLVFLDIAMPDFSGLDVIDKLVQSGRIGDSPIVLFTASSITDTEVAELVKKGVHSCLRKPVRIETLFEKVEEIGKLRASAAKS